MGWQSDWLYRLIFREIENVRAAANRQDAKNGLPPTVYYILEYSDADWEKVTHLGTVKRSWILKKDEPLAETDATFTPGDDAEIDGMFFNKAAIAFHISSDRKRVTFEYFLGPLYARGRILAVHGQGNRAKLISTDGREWIA